MTYFYRILGSLILGFGFSIVFKTIYESIVTRVYVGIFSGFLLMGAFVYCYRYFVIGENIFKNENKGNYI